MPGFVSLDEYCFERGLLLGISSLQRSIVMYCITRDAYIYVVHLWRGVLLWTT